MIKITTDRYGNKGWAVKARKLHYCEATNRDCLGAIQPGTFYFRAIAFPDGDINCGTTPWVMKICRNCLNEYQKPEFDEKTKEKK